ncbi:MAG: META domain-containing protein [Saprospiraceae bacterium]|nr:META domain-containing protein [Saprospiraceae bacterium]
MKIVAYFMCLFVLLSASKCNNDGVKLSNTRWKVIELRQANATSSQLPTKDYILEFRDEKSLGIKLDINNCFGGYEVSAPGKISIQPLACTKACCDSEFAMQITATLSKMATFKVKKEALILEGEGKIRLEQLK